MRFRQQCISRARASLIVQRDAYIARVTFIQAGFLSVSWLDHIPCEHFHQLLGVPCVSLLERVRIPYT